MLCVVLARLVTFGSSVKDSSNGAFIMSTAILPGKFDDGDFDACLREFDACSTANGWKVTEAS